MELKNGTYICPDCAKKMVDNKTIKLEDIDPTRFIFGEKVEINIPYDLYDLVEEHLEDQTYLRDKFDFYMFEEGTVVGFNDSLAYGGCRTYDVELQSGDCKTVVSFPRYMLTSINEEDIDDEYIEEDNTDEYIEEDNTDENKVLLDIDLDKLDEEEIDRLENELEDFAKYINKKYNK